MDTLTLALRPMRQLTSWARLILAGGAFLLAFHVAHPEPHGASHWPMTDVAHQTVFPTPEIYLTERLR
ncbi:MAG TPA: hypothetical protein VGL55_16595 [Steroidobacteraceae bacterium]